MGKAANLASRMGCSLAVLGPVIAIVLYPRAKWLFTFGLIGVAVLILNHLLQKDPSPVTLADQIEALVNGWQTAKWDVDDFEHQHISDPRLRASWLKSIEIGGDPEDWVRLDREKKNQLRGLARDLRNWTTESSLVQRGRHTH